jgi:hypothetical protein
MGDYTERDGTVHSTHTDSNGIVRPYRVAGDIIPGPRPASPAPYRITPVGVRRINQGLPVRAANDNTG